MSPLSTGGPASSPLSPTVPDPWDAEELCEEIEALKRREDATILAHYYQDGEIQELADLAGDSLQLARAATEVETKTIVFCGVHFMAETAKILNPQKRVLLPDLLAGCSLAESCPAPKLAEMQVRLRAEGRRFQTVTYINSTAAVKALSDWVVTSGNAAEIIQRVPDEFEILFVPDKHLGGYLEEVTGRKMILWEGACVVHEIFSVGDLLKLKRRVPKSLTIAHPECPMETVDAADLVGSTEFIRNTINNAPPGSKWAVGTEISLVNRLALNNPDKVVFCLDPVTCPCSTMYRIHPAYLLWVLEGLLDGKVINQITVPEETQREARVALERMLALR